MSEQLEPLIYRYLRERDAVAAERDRLSEKNTRQGLALAQAEHELAELRAVLEIATARISTLTAFRRCVENVALAALENPEHSICPNYLLDLLAVPEEES